MVSTGSAPSNACLAAAAHHVAHDLELFEIAWAERGTRLGWTLWFILARSLMGFFFSSQRKPGTDDILAVDFPAREPWGPLATQLLETAAELPEYSAVRTAANKNAAHLTYKRTDADAASRIAPSDVVHRFVLGVASTWMGRLKPEARVWFGKTG